MRQSTAALLGVLVTVLLASWFFSTHERVTTTEETGYRGEARFNDFLAARMLMSSLGYDAYSRSSLEPAKWLPDTADTIVTRLSNTISARSDRELLMTWVREGGHLVLLPSNYESRTVDNFLESLGYRLVAVDPVDEMAEDEEDEAVDEPDDDEDYEYIINLEHTRHRIELTDPGLPGAMLSDERGIVAVRRELGMGFVTVFASAHYFVNRQIGDHDHARLLMDATAGYLDTATTWFVYDTAYPPLWQIIWTNGPLIVISLALMLLLWLWSVIPKFGPAIHDKPPVRRSIREHVGAAGHFVWRNYGAAALAESAAAAVMHTAEYRHPGISRLPMQKQAQRISAMTGMPEAEVLEVLMDRFEHRPREFTRNMQTLQSIRESL